ncbi:cytochrome c family protein [Chondromyces crocatus]|nr:cytochrome c family protein [Chondromyces crocatus]
MKTHLAASTGLALVALGGACEPQPRTLPAPRSATLAQAPAEPSGGAGVVSAASSEAPTFLCGNLTVPISPGIPGDSPIFANQTNANCFAWWELISLSWPAAPGSTEANTEVKASAFGNPDDTGPVVWQTYQDPTMLFLADGATPPAFGSQPEIPASCALQAKVSTAGKKPPRLVQMVTKFHPGFMAGSSDQAAPMEGPAWLGAQNGTSLWYEVRLNKDLYDSIVAPEHQFFNADKQAAWVAGGNGKALTLPAGSKHADGPIGAIELKGAWMEVDHPEHARWSRYKTVDAIVMDAANGKCRTTTLALVGLHILHKTKSQNTWVWATFEHKDNVPAESPPNPANTPPGGYNFYSQSCQPKQVSVPKDCLAKDMTSPVTVGCTANQSPPYYLGEGCPGPVPIQVTREKVLPSNVQSVNRLAQAAIAEANPKSVWQYYELVNVIWSASPINDSAVPQPAPSRLAGMTSDGNLPVANTTMETYVQGKTCTDCHAYATVASTKAEPKPTWTSDFSFMPSLAQAPAARQPKAAAAVKKKLRF